MYIFSLEISWRKRTSQIYALYTILAYGDKLVYIIRCKYLEKIDGFQA